MITLLKANAVQNVTDTPKSSGWSPENISFESKLSHLVANLRFATTITGSDLGRCIENFQNVLSDTMTETINKVEKYLAYKNVGITDKESKTFFNQFRYEPNLSQYSSMKAQIRCLKKNYSYIDPVEIPLEKRDDRSFKRKLERMT